MSYRDLTAIALTSVLLVSCSENIDANNSIATYLGVVLVFYISYNFLLREVFASGKLAKWRELGVSCTLIFALALSICTFIFGIRNIGSEYKHPRILLIISPILLALTIKQITIDDESSGEAQNNFKLLTFTIIISLSIIYLYNYFGSLVDTLV